MLERLWGEKERREMVENKKAAEENPGKKWKQGHRHKLRALSKQNECSRVFESV